MRTRALTPAALALTATLSGLACETERENLLAPDDLLGPLYGVNRVVQSVTGSGHIDDPTSGEWRNFAFNARKYTDGTVDGEWERFNRRPGSVPSHGDVTCFTIIGNQAWLGGAAETGAPLGEVRWRVVDNGEGNNGSPDQISLQFVGGAPGSAANYCANTPANPALFNVVAGNIQVRP